MAVKDILSKHLVHTACSNNVVVLKEAKVKAEVASARTPVVKNYGRQQTVSKCDEIWISNTT